MVQGVGNHWPKAIQKFLMREKKKNVKKPPHKKQSPVKNHTQQEISKAKLFKCSECKYTNTDLGLVTHHVKIAHKKPFKCGSCDYTNLLKEEVLKHIQITHSVMTVPQSPQKLFKCPDT